MNDKEYSSAVIQSAKNIIKLKYTTGDVKTVTEYASPSDSLTQAAASIILAELENQEAQQANAGSDSEPYVKLQSSDYLEMIKAGTYFGRTSRAIYRINSTILPTLEHQLSVNPINGPWYSPYRVPASLLPWRPQKQSTSSRVPHNPHNVDSKTVETPNYRLLDSDEIKDSPALKEIESYQTKLKTWAGPNMGCDESYTYRTKLTREELEELRKAKA